MLVLYSLTAFLSAVLLFSVEPMVGKMLLPQCGGGPSVWNTCMVFFQGLLLLGYAYTHFTTVRLGVRRQAVLHLAVILLPLFVLPVLFRREAGPPSSADLNWWLLTQLTCTVGLPFFAVSTTAPLLQRWFVRAGSRDPYFLYSTSNAGSLLSLLAYPFLIEPKLGLTMQSQVWTGGYVVLVALLAGCAGAMWWAARPGDKRAPPPEQGTHAADRDHAPISLRQRLSWVLLALVPSSLMLGVTTHLATDVASVPLLWVIPLALYLLTFVLVFARKPLLPHALMIKTMAYAVLGIPLLIFGSTLTVWLAAPLHWLVFFIVSMVCHGELAGRRPAAEHLTEYYLWMSVGGVLGGVLNSLVAPNVGSSVFEYPLMIVVACFLRPAEGGGAKLTDFGFRDAVWLSVLIAVEVVIVYLTRRSTGPVPSWLGIVVCGIPAVVCFGFKERPLRFALGVATVFAAVAYYHHLQAGAILFVQRDFFGVKQVRLAMQDRFHALVHGNTIHGLQKVDSASPPQPASYYYRNGPVGDVFSTLIEPRSGGRIAIVGLGVGTTAAYAQPGQRFTFYEIDPAVTRIATDPQFFTFLQSCPATWDLVLGDGRIQLEKAAEHEFDMIFLDAFSSDSIPMHLLTEEALKLYCAKLREDGVLVFHISNRYLQLEPMLAALAEKHQLACLARKDLTVTAQERQDGKNPSHYVVMARHAKDLSPLSQRAAWSRPAPSAGVLPWTDDYSNILSLLSW